MKGKVTLFIAFFAFFGLLLGGSTKITEASHRYSYDYSCYDSYGYSYSCDQVTQVAYTVTKKTKRYATVTVFSDAPIFAELNYSSKKNNLHRVKRDGTFSKTHKFRLNGLKKGTKYYFQVDFTDSNGISYLTNKASFKTRSGHDY